MARTEINRVRNVVRQAEQAGQRAGIRRPGQRQGLTSNDSGWFGRTEPIGGLGHNQPLAEWVFSAKQGDVSDPIGTPRGIAIAYVEGIRPPGISRSRRSARRSKQDVRRQKAREAARAAAGADDGRRAERRRRSPQKAGQPAQETTVDRQGSIAGLTGDTAALVEAAMNAQRSAASADRSSSADGAVAFQVIEQKKVTADELAQNRAAFVDTPARAAGAQPARVAARSACARAPRSR